jgi:hypothetical protein
MISSIEQYMSPSLTKPSEIVSMVKEGEEMHASRVLNSSSTSR